MLSNNRPDKRDKNQVHARSDSPKGSTESVRPGLESDILNCLVCTEVLFVLQMSAVFV